MMTKQRSTTKTEVRTTTLTPLEEKVVRMRHGYTAPATMELKQVGQEFPDTAAELAQMEQKFLSAVGPRSNTKKRRIISQLRRKSR